MLTLNAALFWLLLGLGFALLEWPYQALSELGFRLQRWGWPLTGLSSGGAAADGGLAPPLWLAALLVFSASLLLIGLAWGPPGRRPGWRRGARAGPGSCGAAAAGAG